MVADPKASLTVEASAREIKQSDNNPAAAPRDFRGPMKIGLAVILLGLGGFFLWAAVAPLDEGAHAPGTLIVDSKRKTVQNFSPGAVKEIHVREGDLVQLDQLLITMDPTQARAQREISDTVFLSAKASEARLVSEQQGLSAVSFPAELTRRSQEPQVAMVLRSQSQLFEARKASLASELGAYRETIAGLRAQVEGLEAVQVQRKLQVDSLSQEIERLLPLVNEGFFARNRHQELQRQLASTQAAFADGASSIARIANQIAEVKLRITQREQEFRKEIEAQLSEVSKEARAQSERLVALDDELRRTEIRSPSAGAVVGLNVSTRGAVLAAGTRIMDIIPADERMIVEAQVDPHLIERIKAGIPAKLMFVALNPRTTPVVDGKLMSISADLLQTPQGIPYYLARIEVPAEALKMLGDVELHAGMPVDVVLVTGERSLLNYLLKPVSDRMSRGLKER
ncbi:MAG: HlyD family type I secretion periplasmic adaptor subunit [Betaproteobacteria bacterium]|nr:HlyD family type I secretion periplasmic adaptor subunit [Betaproteobacteria bacterium]